MTIHLPYIISNNGVIDIVTIHSEHMHTVLKLALNGNPDPFMKEGIEKMIEAIEKRWADTANEDADYEWEH